MRAVVVVDEFYRALRQVKKCAAPQPGFERPNGRRRRARLPILTHVKIEVQADDLSLTCTDLRVADVARVRAFGGVDGAFCVPVRLLMNVVGRLRELNDELTLTVEPARIGAWGSDDDYAKDRDLPTVLVISCGVAQFRLIGHPPSEFPLIDGIPRREAKAPARAMSRIEEVCDGHVLLETGMEG